VTATEATATRPMTGEEYLERLRDDRAIYIYGERVKDVTTHPAFRNSARSIARLYDALHDPATRDVLTDVTDTGSGGFTHRFFKIPRGVDELVANRDAIAAWQRLVYGWLGRAPDYKASFLTTLGGNPDFYEPYQDNARRWYKDVQESVLYFNHAIVHPPVDRHRPPDEVADVYVHVEKETDNGIVVSGAKVVATASALTNYNFIAHYGVPLRKREFALIFLVPMGAPGLKLISRASYEMQAALLGTPFDYPLSSRFDENDSILVLDNVLVPWENVLIYGDIEKANSFILESGFVQRLTFHGLTRLCVKLDFIAGLILKAVEATGTSEFRGVQAAVGEIIAWRNLFWALTDGMARNPSPWVDDAVHPNLEYGLSYRVFAPVMYPRVKDIVESTVGSGLIYLNSHAADFKSAEIRPYLDKYVRGSEGMVALDRVKLLKLLWDAMGTEFGGRHELYERMYAGNADDVRIQTLQAATAVGTADQMRGFAEQCMAEYDLDGWTVPHLINPDDLETVTRQITRF
jgi:4-hydroxyphenylacetate 3-monooxygenase